MHDPACSEVTGQPAPWELPEPPRLEEPHADETWHIDSSWIEEDRAYWRTEDDDNRALEAYP